MHIDAVNRTIFCVWDAINGICLQEKQYFERRRHGKYKRKSGGVTLQRVRFLDGVTHRIMVYGNPKDWGTEEKRPQMAWQSYLRGMRSLRSSAKGSYTAKSMYWKGGDRDKYKVGRQWLFKACLLYTSPSPRDS